MKKYCITLLVCFCCIAGYGQGTYYVSVVKGRILKGSTAIKAGDKLTANDKVRFSAKTDQLILLNPGSGRLVLSPQYAVSQKNISLAGSIKDFLDLSAQRQKLSSKTGKPADSVKVKNQPALRADSMRSIMLKHR